MSCQVMGIVNVTPDSFSDGGKYFEPAEAVRRVRKALEEGAAIVDLGGESTRPGATPLEWAEEWARLKPVIGAAVELAQAAGARVSVDTYHVQTAERALAAGATIVNCVAEEPLAEMWRLCEPKGVELVVPAAAVGRLPVAALPRLYLDPMVGFGTTREEDLSLLRRVDELARRGRVLVGASRKRIVKRLTGVKAAGKDLAGNLAIAVWCALKGASVVRVHDVRETVQALKVVAALAEGELPQLAAGEEGQ